MDKRKICAIISAYNEEERIEGVLIPLMKSKLVDEIIVVDDGSTDNTLEVARKFNPRVKYVRNRENMGKGLAMDVGVKSTDAEIIFFCDADLKNITPEIIDGIIKPVLRGEVEMFVGTRNGGLGRRIGFDFEFLSGQRALKRELWERLPAFYKKRFRTEVGLNYFAKTSASKVFNFQQTLKERKYKLPEALRRRLSMDIDIALAWLRHLFRK